MIKKINENAYFVMDYSSWVSSITEYNHTIANQQICSDDSGDQLDLQDFEIENQI